MTQPVMIWGNDEKTAASREPWDISETEAAVVPSRVVDDGVTVTRDDRVWGGKAVIAGTRIPVFMVVDLYESGLSVEQICDRYPHISEADVWEALAHAGRYRGQINQDRTIYAARIPRRYRY